MEIGLPDDAGREQIWKIHTAKVNSLEFDLYNMKFLSLIMHEDAGKQYFGSWSSFGRDG
jgi:hypothetical protein